MTPLNEYQIWNIFEAVYPDAWLEDAGIGPYEFWGARGVDISMGVNFEDDTKEIYIKIGDLPPNQAIQLLLTTIDRPFILNVEEYEIFIIPCIESISFSKDIMRIRFFWKEYY